MQHNIKLSIKILALSLLAFMTSCIDDVKSPESTVIAEDNAITLSLFTENEEIATRSGLSDGTTVNRLYYCIYKKEVDGNYVVDPYYHKDNKYKEFKFEAEERKNFTIKLLPDPDADDDQVYKIVCWAQYTQEVTDAKGDNTYKSLYYDISNFPNIKVIYDKDNEGNNIRCLNNDEYRDAFYASKEFSASQKGSVVNVELYRPFAQINIGTSGWDYEGLATIEPNPQIVKYSKITVKGVATKLDLLKNQTSDKKEDLVDVTFDFDVIPAYRNLEKENLKDLTGINLNDHNIVEEEDDNGKTIKTEGIFHKLKREEEFLKIDLEDITKPDGIEEKEFDTNKDGYADYIGWKKYAGYCDESGSHENLLYNIYTETFKYLSMCYVLVPFQTSDASVDSTKETSGDSSQDYGSTVEIEFDCAEADDSGECKDTGILGAGKNVIELKNVPVARNYRTNIIAADGTGFFMNSNELNVAIYPEPFADYYRRLGATDKDWNDKGPEGDEDRNGDSVNDGYEWGNDDIDSEYGKMPLVLSKVTGFKVGFDGTDHESGNIDKNYIDVYLYSDEKVTVNFDPTGRYDEVYTYIKGNQDLGIESFYGPDDFAFECSLYDETITDIKDVTDASGTKISGQKSVTFDVDKLYSLIDKVKPVETILNEYETWFDPNYTQESISEFADDSKTSLRMKRNEDVPVLRYYPLEFKIRTIVRAGDTKFKGGDLTVTIRLHTSYKFTFSSTSTDEGGEVWNDLIRQGKTANEESQSSDGIVSRNETGSYYIDAKKVAVSNIGRISATSRVASDGITGGSNHRLFAIVDPNIGDHLKFKGNAFKNGDGHYITLHNIRENCAITVKMGRDYGQDDSDKEGVASNRALYVDWTGAHSEAAKLADNWYGYDGKKDINYNATRPENENKVYLLGTTYRHQYDETKILSSPTTEITDFSSAKDVLLYSLDTGYCVYWVIVSEGNDKNWLN